MDTKSARILITGGTRGIGRALAVRLAGDGARVLACGSSSTSARRLTEQSGIEAVVCDVTEAEDVRGLVEHVSATLGGLDVLVNCAGVQSRMDILRGFDMHAVEREVAINLTGPVRMTSAMMGLLIESSNPVIVNVTSILAWAPKRSAPIYCATKAGLSSWTRSLRAQLATRGVRVVEVVPPVVATDMTAGRQDGAIPAEQMANAIAEGLSRGHEEILVGKSRLARLLWRLSPRALERQLVDS